MLYLFDQTIWYCEMLLEFMLLDFDMFKNFNFLVMAKLYFLLPLVFSSHDPSDIILI